MGENKNIPTGDLKMPTTYSALVNKAREYGYSVVQTFSILCSDEQDKRYADLLKTTKSVDFFECEGVLFKGSREQAVIDFMINNPQPADFYVWLQRNREMYTAVK